MKSWKQLTIAVTGVTLLAPAGLVSISWHAKASAQEVLAPGSEVYVLQPDGYYIPATIGDVECPPDQTADCIYEIIYPDASADGAEPSSTARRDEILTTEEAAALEDSSNAGETAAQDEPAAETTPAPDQNSSAPAADTGSTACEGVTVQLTDAEISEILRVHNQARAEVGVSPLTWNCRLASFAQSWADRDEWEHSSQSARENIIPGSYVGENLAAAAPASDPLATSGPTGWLAEGADWNNATGSCTPGKVCGHYTQMVWRSTTEIGCGINRHSSVMGDEWANNSAYLVCNYNPGGNYGNSRPF